MMDRLTREKCEFYEMDDGVTMMILIFVFFRGPRIRMMILKRLYIFSAMCCKNGFWLDVFVVDVLFLLFGRFFFFFRGTQFEQTDIF